MQRVNPDIGDAFRLVYMALWDAFVPEVFQGVVEETPGWGVTRLPVKQTVLELPDIIKTSTENLIVSCVITGHLVAALMGQGKFKNADHDA